MSDDLAARIDAMMAMLLDSGDITPQGARLVRLILAGRDIGGARAGDGRPLPPCRACGGPTVHDTLATRLTPARPGGGPWRRCAAWCQRDEPREDGA